MIEKKFITAQKQEFMIMESINKFFGKGKVGDVRIERTPIGEKIIIYTSRPGLIVGKKGENIQQLVQTFKRDYGLEAPQIEVVDVSNQFDAKSVGEQIALSLERFGPLGFKIVAYRMIEKLSRMGCLGAEIILSGKLPSERARSLRFAFGYMQKTGDFAMNVDSANVTAQTLPGTVGIKVSIIPPDAKISDQIKLDKAMVQNELKKQLIVEEIKEVEEKKPGKKKERKKREKKEKKENGNIKK